MRAGGAFALLQPEFATQKVSSSSSLPGSPSLLCFNFYSFPYHHQEREIASKVLCRRFFSPFCGERARAGLFKGSDTSKKSISRGGA